MVKFQYLRQKRIMNKKVRDKCVVRIIPCVFVQFEGAKNDSGRYPRIRDDDGIAHDFMRFCLNEGMPGLNSAGGLSGPGIYYHAHFPEHKDRIIEWFKKEGIKVEEY